MSLNYQIKQKWYPQMGNKKDVKLVITILMLCIIFLSYKTYILNSELNEKAHYKNFIVSGNFEGKFLQNEYFEELNSGDSLNTRIVFVVNKKICSTCFTEAIRKAGKFVDDFQIVFVLSDRTDPILSNIIADPNSEKFRLIFSKKLSQEFINNTPNGLIFIEHKGEILLAEGLSKLNTKRIKLFFNKLKLLKKI